MDNTMGIIQVSQSRDNSIRNLAQDIFLYRADALVDIVQGSE